ncbi:hypothetical protein EJ07DRAFT_173340 [Lizonia empirigonia]|nr:hypothetical protein EJ07DRAFT_173340 [Lizonia empirigonia]
MRHDEDREQSIRLILRELERRGKRIDRETWELASTRDFTEERTPTLTQLLFENGPREEHHIYAPADDVIVEERQAPDIHVHEQAPREFYYQSQSQTITNQEQKQEEEQTPPRLTRSVRPRVVRYHILALRKRSQAPQEQDQGKAHKQEQESRPEPQICYPLFQLLVALTQRVSVSVSVSVRLGLGLMAQLRRPSAQETPRMLGPRLAIKKAPEDSGNGSVSARRQVSRAGGSKVRCGGGTSSRLVM